MATIGGPVVLAYHAINRVDPAADPYRLVTAPEHLESHVRTLQRLGYAFLTAGQVLERWPDGRPRGRTAVVTVDDGWLDGLTIAAPLLERLGVRATFYVCPGWLDRGGHPLVAGDAGRLLDAAGARELHERMEIASHTMSHPDLRELGDAELAAELSGSRAAVEELTGAPCRTLAYPYGAFDDRVERAARAAGYELAYTWATGRHRPTAAPRLPAPVRAGGARLVSKMAGMRVPDRLFVAARGLRTRRRGRTSP